MRRQYTQFEWRITLRIRTFHPAFERIFELRIKGDSPSRHWDGALFWCLHATVSWPTAAFGLCPAVSFLEKNISKLLFVDLPKHMSDSEHAGQCWHTIHISINLSSQSTTAMIYLSRWCPCEKTECNSGPFHSHGEQHKVVPKVLCREPCLLYPWTQSTGPCKQEAWSECWFQHHNMTANDAHRISMELIQECSCIHRSLGGKPADKRNTCLKLWFSPIWYSWIRGQ